LLEWARFLFAWKSSGNAGCVAAYPAFCERGKPTVIAAVNLNTAPAELESKTLRAERVVPVGGRIRGSSASAMGDAVTGTHGERIGGWRCSVD
jgi:hypothetical protein